MPENHTESLDQPDFDPEEVERVYGKRDREELERMIFEETEANLKKGE